MYPYLIKFGSFELRIYSLMYLLAIIIALYFCKKKSVSLGYKKDLIENAIIITFIGAIIGARFYYVLFNYGYFRDHLFEIFALWQGGLAIHGGIIGGFIAAIFYCKYKKISLFAFGDMILPFLLLGQALGRFGNFTNGEAHGVPTFIPPSIIFSLKNRFYDFWNTVLATLDIENSYKGFHKLYNMIKDKGQIKVFFEDKIYILKEYVPWGVKFPEKYMSPAYMQFDSLPLHPTFFYEMILNFICAGILIYLWRDNKNIGKGTIVGLYLIFYAIIRGFVTFFRADDLMIGYFRAPHVASFIMLLIGFLIIYVRGKNLQ